MVWPKEQGKAPQEQERPNFNHLLYFWKVARLGSIAKAAEALSVSQPTISGQLRALDAFMEEPLFTRSGRKLILSDFGKVIFRYADEIFGTSAEMMRVVRDRSEGVARPLHVGILDALPKVIVHRLLAPALRARSDARLSCAEGDPLRLLEGLARHDHDVLLSDHPLQADRRLPIHNHRLLTTGCVVMATARRAMEASRNFPRSLDNAPFLLPAKGALLRQDIDRWLTDRGLHVRCVAEFDDSALLKQFGGAGEGYFVAPAVAKDELQASHGVRVVGPMPDIEQSFYAVTTERRIDHPLLSTLLQS